MTALPQNWLMAPKCNVHAVAPELTRDFRPLLRALVEQTIQRIRTLLARGHLGDQAVARGAYGGLEERAKAIGVAGGHGVEHGVMLLLGRTEELSMWT
jgi:hypothetical protein